MPKTSRKAKENGKLKKPATQPSKLQLLHLYEASVQCPEADIKFIDRLFKKKNGRRALSLREDFCGSSSLACDWVKTRKDRTAIGLDLDAKTLRWAEEHNVASIGDAAERVDLRQSDVRSVTEPVDLILGLNFSYWIFKERQDLLDYFKKARASLKPDGLLVLDAFGGTEAMCEGKDEKHLDSSEHRDGTHVPKFTYSWRQHRFNPIDHHFICYIDFKVKGRHYPKAFGYDWRFWTMGEVRELLLEAGFADVEVYVDDFDDDGESDGVYRLRRRFDNEGVWVAYIVGLT